MIELLKNSNFMLMKKNEIGKMKCILWTTAIRDLFDPSAKPGGVSIQMLFWGLTFLEKDWKVYSFTCEKRIERIEGIEFIPTKRFPIYQYLLYPFYALSVLRRIKPDIIITRAGLNRNIFWISILAKIMKIKHIHFIASDMELSIIPKTFVQTFNYRMFLLGLRSVGYIVVQNVVQYERVKMKFYKKPLLLIPNIWKSLGENMIDLSISDYVLWVANFRQLKRPDRFIRLAKHFPNIHFVMIGAINELEVYEQSQRQALNVPNLHIEGKKDFFTTNCYFSKAKIFVCSSEYEGLPNTFLQAWSYNIPVISTVDPNDMIKNNGLGIACSDDEDLLDAVRTLFYDEKLYNQFVQNISYYFMKNYSSTFVYEKIINFIDKI